MKNSKFKLPRGYKFCIRETDRIQPGDLWTDGSGKTWPATSFGVLYSGEHAAVLIRKKKASVL